MTDKNKAPAFVRTQQDATQFATAFKQTAEELSSAPASLFAKVKPPFKCSGCKRKIQLNSGYKVSKEKLCERCIQTALTYGYQQVKRSEALTGRRLLSDEARAAADRLTQQEPNTN